MGTTMAWIGASRGGRISPWSSPCTITIAPTRRVLTPQEVVQQYWSWLFLSKYRISNARAKFCPKKWEVPICRAFLSPIIPSMV